MRAALSLVGLLVVLFIVARLAGTQLGGGKPEAAPAATAASAADRVQRALQQAADARASDAAGR